MLKISDIELFSHNSKIINKKHFSQTLEDVKNLNEKYSKVILGKIEICDLIYRLAHVVDPTDIELLNNTQLMHVFQVLEAMENENASEEMKMMGLLHDIGKFLVCVDEKPENIFCGNKVIGKTSFGIGLDNCMFQWNHDEFAYIKLKEYLNYEQLWLIRYHSIYVNETKPFMNKNDIELCDKYLLKFKKYDKHTKSPTHKPQIDLEKYLRIVEKFIPRYIEI